MKTECKRNRIRPVNSDEIMIYIIWFVDAKIWFYLPHLVKRKENAKKNALFPNHSSFATVLCSVKRDNSLET
jgi:hypothetical protein